MLSFSKVITFAAVAFGTLSQAVPLSLRGVSIEPRAQTPVRLEDVLTGLTTQLKVALAPINTLTSENATVPFIRPILEDVNILISDVAKLVEELVVEPVDEILADVDGVLLVVDDVLVLVQDVLEVVFEALKIVAGLVEDLSGLLEILPILVDTVSVLIKNIIKITAVVFGNAVVVRLQALVASTFVAGVLSSLGLLPISL